jgi:heat shock protein HslJ
MRTAKRSALACLAAATALVLAGCAAADSAKDAAPDPRLRGSWQLVSGSDRLGDFQMDQTLMTLSVGSARETHGATPCGSFGASVRGSAGAIWITVAPHTSKGCAGLDTTIAQLDVRFVQALARSTEVAVTRQGLTMRAPGTELEFEPLLPSPVSNYIDKTLILTSFTPIGTIFDIPISARYSSIMFTSQESFRLSTACGLTNAKIRRTTNGFSLENAATTDWALVNARSRPCNNDERTEDVAVTKIILHGEFSVHRVNVAVLQIDSDQGRLTFHDPNEIS